MKTPYISREDVAAALSSLIHSVRKPEATSLQHLLLVDLLVSAPDMPSGADVRDYVVCELLVSEITRALSEQRALFRLDPPDESARLDEVWIALSADRTVGAAELLAWSTLYYRFARSDLDISVSKLANILTVDPRTIARYNDEGIGLLTQRLIKAEQMTRRAQLERRLNATLPSSVPVRMVGRDELLHSVAVLLPNLSPCHILITGETGIGKTTFAQELLRSQIVAGDLDQIIWLDQPTSAEFIRQQLVELLLRESEEVTLRDYLLLYHVAIVLDDIELASIDRMAFSDLLGDLSASLVFLINRNDVTVDGIEARLALPEIDSQAANLLAHEIFQHQHMTSPALWNRVMPDIYTHVGGNPLAIKMAVTLWDDIENWEALQTEVQERLLDKVFNELDIREQAIWCALALLPRPTTLSELAAIWEFLPENIGKLARYSLLEQSSEQRLYMLVSAARAYIKARYSEVAEIRQVFQQVIAAISLVGESFDVMENILMVGFPALDLARRTNWITTLWEEGLRRGHWARWRAVLGDYLVETENVSLELRIAYGICLRRLSDWRGAEQVFYDVVADCGRTGNFAQQARTFLEWSILNRYQGNYIEAQAMTAQAKRYAQRTHDDALLNALTLQEAQLLLQQGKGAEAEQLLTALPESVLILTLHSEALLVLGQHEACRSLAEGAIRLIHNDQATESSLYTIVGRSYEREHDYMRAHHAFTNAVTLLERLEATFALARAQTNLASVLIPMKRFMDAETLLARAEPVQTRLSDQVGLIATRHNQAILRGNFAR